MSPGAALAVGGGAMARIADIRSRFEAPLQRPVASTAPTAAAPAFASMLAAATAAGVETPVASDAGAAADERVVELAREYLGVPYRWGGTDPATGLDCSGFVQHLFRRVGVELPRVSRDQARAGTEVPSLDQARPGDLVAFGEPVDHIGVYVGDGKYVHAPHRGASVRIDDLGSRRIATIRRVLPAEGAGATPVATTAGAAVPGLAGGAGGSVLPRAIVPAVRRFEPLFVEAGRRHGIDPAVLAAQCQKESAGRTDVVSSAGALGLMQFMPATARSRGVDPLDPASAIDGAAAFLAELRNQFGGSMELALAAYNAGPGAVRRAGNTHPSDGVRRYTQSVLALAGGPR